VQVGNLFIYNSTAFEFYTKRSTKQLYARAKLHKNM